MGSTELVNWIKQNKSKYTAPQLRNYLVKYGYAKQDIDEALDFLKGHSKVELKMPPPPPPDGLRIGNDYWEKLAIGAVIAIFFFPMAAIPLGILSLRHLKHNPNLRGKGLAIAGIIVGICQFLLSLLIMFVVFIIPLLLR